MLLFRQTHIETAGCSNAVGANSACDNRVMRARRTDALPARKSLSSSFYALGVVSTGFTPAWTGSSELGPGRGVYQHHPPDARCPGKVSESHLVHLQLAANTEDSDFDLFDLGEQLGFRCWETNNISCCGLCLWIYWDLAGKCPSSQVQRGEYSNSAKCVLECFQHRQRVNEFNASEPQQKCWGFGVLKRTPPYRHAVLHCGVFPNLKLSRIQSVYGAKVCLYSSTAPICHDRARVVSRLRYGKGNCRDSHYFRSFRYRSSNWHCTR